MENADKIAEFQSRIDNEGWMLFPNVLDQNTIARLIGDVEKVYAIQRQIQARNDVDYPGVAQHVIMSLWRGGSFADVLENLPLKEYADAYFGAPKDLNEWFQPVEKRMYRMGQG